MVTLLRIGVVSSALLLTLAIGPRPAGSAEAISQKIIAADKLPNSPGNQLTAMLVALPPGARAPRHHHAGFVFVYVLTGRVRSQLNRAHPVDYDAGQSWVEPPGTEHTMVENPSRSRTARLLAVFVAPTGAQLTTFDK